MKEQVMNLSCRPTTLAPDDSCDDDDCVGVTPYLVYILDIYAFFCTFEQISNHVLKDLISI